MANNRLSDLLQILVYLEIHHGEVITSERLASSLNSNPSLVRQMIGQLRKAELLCSRRGVAGATLTRSPEEITVHDVYKAIDSEDTLLKVDYRTSQECSVGIAFPNVLEKHYQKIQIEAESQMKQITIAQLVAETKDDIAQHVE